MNVLQLGKYHPDCAGGIEYVTAIYCDAINSLGHEVFGIYFSNEESSKNETEIVLKSIDFLGQPLTPKYFQTVFKMAQNSSVIIAHLPNFLACFALIFLRIFKPNHKLIVVWHADIVSQTLMRQIIAKLLRILEIFCVSAVDFVVFTSKEYARHSYIQYWCKKKSVIIPITIENKTDVSARMLKPTRRLLFVGRLVEYKGAEHLIKAFANLPYDYQLTIAGDGPLHKKLAQMIDNLRLGDRVSLLGGVTDTELKELYSSADVFILPSVDRAEAYGVVLIEAMSYGLPLITNRLEGSGMIEVNRHNFTGLQVNVHDHISFAAAIEKIFDETLYTRFSTNCKLSVDRRFSPDQLKNKLEDII